MPKRTAASILLLEDEVLILLDLEYYLRTAGFEIAAALSSCASALEWLSSNTPDIAMLDIELRDGVCVDVAHTFHQRSIPFVVYSGSTYDPEFHDAVFLNGEWLHKPSYPSEVIASLFKLRPVDSSRLDLRSDRKETFVQGPIRYFLPSVRMDLVIV